MKNTLNFQNMNIIQNLAKEIGNNTAMKKIKDKLRSDLIDRDTFYDLVEIEEATIKSEKARMFAENNKLIDESCENVISKVIDQNIIKAKNSMIVKTIQKTLTWISIVLRIKLKNFIETKFCFLAPHTNRKSNEAFDLAYLVSKSFLNLFTHALINGDKWTTILNILKKNVIVEM